MTAKKVGTVEQCPEDVSHDEYKTDSCVNGATIIPFPQSLSASRQWKRDFPHWGWLTDEYIAAAERLEANEAKARALLQHFPELQVGVPYLMATPPIPASPEIRSAVLKKLLDAGFTDETAQEALDGLKDQSGSVDEILSRILLSRCQSDTITGTKYQYQYQEPEEFSRSDSSGRYCHSAHSTIWLTERPESSVTTSFFTQPVNSATLVTPRAVLTL